MIKKFISLFIYLTLITLSFKSFAFGVIVGNAFGGHFSIATNYRSFEAAENAAKNGCVGECRPQKKFQFHNACAAWASGGAFFDGFAIKSTQIEAENRAIEVCNSRPKDRSCTVVISGCDGDYIEAEQKEREKRWAEEQDARTKAEIKKAASCLGYKTAKFFCASAGNIDACMNIRFGADYMTYEYRCQ